MKPTRLCRRRDFIERTLDSLFGVRQHAIDAERTTQTRGLLQSLDPRVKVIGLLGLVVAVALARNFLALGVLLGCAIALAVLSRVSLKTLAVRVWLSVGVFTVAIALPALFLTPGTPLGRLPLLDWTFTQQGVRSALFLLLRVEACATFSLLLVLCTPWVQLLKALRVLRVPVVIVVILGMTHRSLFLLLQTASEMWEARRVRRVGTLDGALRRRMAMSAVGALMEKSLGQGQEVHQAMLARGYRGEVYTLDEFSLNTRDWIAGFGFFAATICALFLGRL